MIERQCLYHYPICPLCRKIRFLFYENGVKNCAFKIENFWEHREKFCRINPTGKVPFLAIQQEEDGEKKSLLIWGKNSIVNYLRQKYPVETLLYGSIENQANILKYDEWFETQFYDDVSYPIINERVYTFYKKKREINLEVLKMARFNLKQHMNFIEKMLQNRDWIVGDKFSLADLSCACQLSSLDYLGEINWADYPMIKNWYQIIKSKPSFREFLYDTIPDFKPSVWYRELDF